jgi:hypothetical protein
VPAQNHSLAALTARRAAREPPVEKQLSRLNHRPHARVELPEKRAVKHDALIMVDCLRKRNTELRNQNSESAEVRASFRLTSEF